MKPPILCLQLLIICEAPGRRTDCVAASLPLDIIRSLLGWDQTALIKLYREIRHPLFDKFVES